MDEHNQPPRPPQMPGSSPQPPEPSPNMQDLRELKVVQNLLVVACIAGPVSLFIGGVFLGTAGLVCAIVGFRKLRALTRKSGQVAAAANRVKKSCIVAIVGCSLAIVLNAISAYLMYPAVLEALETGNYGNLAPGADPTPPETSIWG